MQGIENSGNVRE